MSNLVKQILKRVYTLPILVVTVASFCPSVSAAPCAKLPSDKGTAHTTFTVATAGTYRLWAHVYASTSGSSFDLAIDNGCSINMGQGKLSAPAFHWIQYTNGTTTPVTVTLANGKHTLTIAGQAASVGVDQILLLTNTSCVPVGSGTNCETSGDGSATVQTPKTPNSAPVTTGASSSQNTQRTPATTTQGSPKQKMSAAELTAYIAAVASIAALAAAALLYYGSSPNSLLSRIPFLKNRGQYKSGDGHASAVVVSEMPSDMQTAGPSVNRKRIILVAVVFAGIGGLATFLALAATNTYIAIGLANAQVSGQAKVVANTSAIGGRMVQFGSGKTATKPPTSTHQGGGASGTPPSGSGGTGSSGTGSGTLMKNVSCKYGNDTWSGDSAKVGYSVSKIANSDGNPASFSAKINAQSGTTEVVGYPSDQCLLYSALPSNLTSAFKITPPASSSGLDYEYAYDIWLTTSAAATASNWNNDLELMIWNYVNGQVPAGSVKTTLSDGSKVWVSGNNVSGTVSVVLPKNETSGTVNISSIVSQLKSLGYVTSADNGILDVEYGIEAPYGGGQTFTVDSLSLSD